MTQRSQHIWKPESFLPDKSYAEESCACGAVSRRYKAGTRKFRQPDGFFRTDQIPCTLEGIDTDEVMKLRARLLEAHVVIAVMVGELAEARMWTKGRRMGEGLLMCAKLYNQ